MVQVAGEEMASATVKVISLHGAEAEAAAMSDAEKCRKNGWRVGDRLVGDEGYGPTVIELTAIGRDGILAVQLSHNGDKSQHEREGHWTLSNRKWRRVRP